MWAAAGTLSQVTVHFFLFPSSFVSIQVWVSRLVLWGRAETRNVGNFSLFLSLSFSRTLQEDACWMQGTMVIGY